MMVNKQTASYSPNIQIVLKVLFWMLAMKYQLY